MVVSKFIGGGPALVVAGAGGTESGVTSVAVGFREELDGSIVEFSVDAWRDSWEPVMQAEQYQGVFRQFAVVFLRSVHFLWKRFLHLPQGNS